MSIRCLFGFWLTALIQSTFAASFSVNKRSGERAITDEYRTPLPDARHCHRPKLLRDPICSADVDNTSCRLPSYDCNSFYLSLSGPANRNTVEDVGSVCNTNKVSTNLSSMTSTSVRHLCEYDVVCKNNPKLIPSTYWEAKLRHGGDKYCKDLTGTGIGHCRAIQHELHVLKNEGCDSRVGQQRYRPTRWVVTVAFACTSMLVK